MFAFAFLPLSDPTGTVLRDGRHTLRCYKPVSGLETGLTTPWYLVAPVVDMVAPATDPASGANSWA